MTGPPKSITETFSLIFKTLLKSSLQALSPPIHKRKMQNLDGIESEE